MKIETLKERIEKATIKIEKKHNTIEKKKALIEKKANKVRALGFDLDAGVAWEQRFDEKGREAYWLICEIGYLKEDIERGQKEIPEIEALIEKYKKQLAGEIEKEATISEMPEVMKQMQSELVTEWDQWDKDYRARLREAYNNMTYREFIKKYNYSGYQHMQLTDDEIHNRNEKDARALILDLYNRVKAITGEITDYRHLELTRGNMGAVLNGYVVGKTGRASVESILAGGYNIQRLHIRTLVHEII